jgi:hypothetical protein
LSAPSGSGGSSGVGALLSGAGGMVATASPRQFQQGIPFTEATRLDWDVQEYLQSAAGFALGATISTFQPGRGTWLIQCQIAFTLSGSPGDGTVVMMKAPGTDGFRYDICAPCAGSGVETMDAVIALGLTDQVIARCEFTFVSGTISVLWNGKRITR